jgi:multicomponent Na+:H+ antiporter subunit F
MDSFYIGIALFLLLNIIAGMVRVFRGPEPADRIMAVLLFGSTAVAILLLLSQAMNLPELRNIALVFALLSILGTVAFVKRCEMPHPEEEGD